MTIIIIITIINNTIHRYRSIATITIIIITAIIITITIIITHIIITASLDQAVSQAASRDIGDQAVVYLMFS
jgi:hypothetical protein